jgi:hypothetical protein
MALFKAELNLHEVEVGVVYLVLAFARAFYSSRPGSYNETLGPIGGPVVGKTLCSRALMAKCSK